MEDDPNIGFDADGHSVPGTVLLPPDPSWSDFFDGIWRRMNDPLPRTVSG